MPSLLIENLSFSYNRGGPVLQDISLHVQQGEFICLLGLSGCGKSTLLRLIAGLEHPDKGRLYWKGDPISNPSIERAGIPGLFTFSMDDSASEYNVGY